MEYKNYKDTPNLEPFFLQIFKKCDQELKLVGAADSGATCCMCIVRK